MENRDYGQFEDLRRIEMSSKPMYLGHVNINVRIVEQEHKWYENILGLHTYDFVPGRAAFMSANSRSRTR